MADETMRTVRFHDHGEPADVLVLEQAPVPIPGAGHVRIRVHACALNPADWALCRGLFSGGLPRGIGLDVSGTVDALGEGVTGVAIGDLVLGVPDFVNYSSAGASDRAVLAFWTPVPDGLDLIHAAALPMAIETATRSLDLLGIEPGQTLLVNGGGTTVGFSAVQIALTRGIDVIATSGDTLAGLLRDLGAKVTGYGDGVVERVREIAGGAPDRVLDTAPPGGVLPDLIAIAGEAGHVLTISDFEDAERLGVRTTGQGHEDLRYDAIPTLAQRAAEGAFSIPVAKTYALDDWRSAMEESLSGHAHGKLVLLT